MKRIALIGSMLSVLAPSAVLAEMRYSGFEVSLVDVEVDVGPVSVDGDGFAIGGAYELNEKFYLFGEWQDQSFDFGIDGRALELGGGFHHPLSPTMDFVATLSYLDAEVDAGGASADDDGLGLGGGIRTRLADSFEVDASLQLVDMDEGGSDTGFRFGGRYFFNNTMAIGLRADFADDADTLSLGFRAEF